MNYELKLPDGYVKPKLLRRDKWTAALRSGEYNKGHLYLHSLKHGTFCCLGVLATIEGIHTGSNCQLPSDTPQFKDLGEHGDFPKGVVIVNSHARGGFENCLSGVNDSCALGLTFPEIADIIEQIWDNDDGINPPTP